MLPRFGRRPVQILHDLAHDRGACRRRGLPAARYAVTDLDRRYWGLAAYIVRPPARSVNGRRLFHVRDAGFGESGGDKLRVDSRFRTRSRPVARTCYSGEFADT